MRSYQRWTRRGESYIFGLSSSNKKKIEFEFRMQNFLFRYFGIYALLEKKKNKKQQPTNMLFNLFVVFMCGSSLVSAHVHFQAQAFKGTHQVEDDHPIYGKQRMDIHADYNITTVDHYLSFDHSGLGVTAVTCFDDFLRVRFGSRELLESAVPRMVPGVVYNGAARFECLHNTIPSAFFRCQNGHIRNVTDATLDLHAALKNRGRMHALILCAAENEEKNTRKRKANSVPVSPAAAPS